MQLFGDETSDQLILKSDPNIKRSQSNGVCGFNWSWYGLIYRKLVYVWHGI